MAACSATGEKLPLLVIGKSENPRCFRGYEKASLGVRWEANKKAWMTTDIFRKWLTHLNNSMSRAGRHILLLLDNCPAHPDLQFSNIKLVFLPKNTTSRLQPLDAGIIQNIKLQYRKRMMRHLLHVMDQCNSVSELVKRVTVLDAIGWLRAAWESVQTTTINSASQSVDLRSNLLYSPLKKMMMMIWITTRYWERAPYLRMLRSMPISKYTPQSLTPTLLRR